MTLSEQKRELRRIAGARILALETATRASADRTIGSLLLALPEFVTCTEVITYWPLKDEVDVAEFNAAAFRADKKVYLPTSNGAGNLVFRRWSPGDALKVGRHGVKEPGTGDAPLDRSGFVLVPGRAFSSSGVRLGRGGGYYDRAMPSLSLVGTTVGVAYACQLYDEIPHDARDERVDNVVTEAGALRCLR